MEIIPKAERRHDIDDPRHFAAERTKIKSRASSLTGEPVAAKRYDGLIRSATGPTQRSIYFVMLWSHYSS
jgi:hypothetical protein